MDVLNDISPYWCTDPLLAESNLRQVAHIMNLGSADPDDGDGLPDVRLLYGLPSCPIPVASPAAYAPELGDGRGLAGWLLPYPWLPDVMWMRYPGESLPGWLMRVIMGMDRLGLFQTDDGTITFRDVDGVPESEDGLAAIRNLFDRRQTDTGKEAYEEVRSRYADLMREVWPDGYPLEAMIEAGGLLAAQSLSASPVLAARNALALNMEGESETAVGLLKRVRSSYGSLFDSELTPQGVSAWVGANRGRVEILLDTLVEWRLESRDIRDAVLDMVDQAGGGR